MMATNDELLKTVSELLFLSLDEGISAEQFLSLEEILLNNRTAREYYFSLVNICVGLNDIEGILGLEDLLNYDEEIWGTLLKYEKEAPTVIIEKPKQELIQKVVYPPRQKHKVSKFQKITFIASVAAMLFIGLFAKLAPFLPSMEVETVDQKSLLGMEVATLVEQVDAVWNKNGQVPDYESKMLQGAYSLTSGYAKINFKDGANVIVQAPVKFFLENSRQMYLERGRIVVKMNGKANQKFLVRSPWASVLDHGTEFGVEVASEGLQTYVFEGEVSLINSLNSNLDPNSDFIPLKAGEGGKATFNQGIIKTTVNNRDFVRAEIFEILRRASEGSAYHRWKLYSMDLSKDPSLVAYYTFEKGNLASDDLVNEAYSGSVLNGKIESYSQYPNQWVTGRWNEKTALRFGRQTKHVTIPAVSQLAIQYPITVSAWVHFFDTDKRGTIISCRNQTDINFHLQIPHKDDIKGNRPVYIPCEALKHVAAEPFDFQQNCWYMLTVTFDNQYVTFYINGNTYERKPYSHDRKSPVLEATIIGNSLGGPSLLADLDEIAIFNRVLSLAEIKTMYEYGKTD